MITGDKIKAARSRYSKDEWQMMAGLVAILEPEKWDDARDNCILVVAAELRMMSAFFTRMDLVLAKQNAGHAIPDWANEWFENVATAQGLPEPGIELVRTWMTKLDKHLTPEQVVESMGDIASGGTASRAEVRNELLSIFRDAYTYYLEDLFDDVCAATEFQIQAMKDD